MSIVHSPQRLARTAGVYYLVVAVLGAFAHLVRARVYVPGDAATSTQNVVSDASLVNYSLVADLVQATFLVLVVMTLYRLLHHVSENWSRAMVIFVVIAVAITCLNMVHQLGALLIATDPAYAAAIGVQGSDALVLLMLDLQHHGYLIAQIFFGLWLLPLGLLAYRSGMFPRVLGQLLMFASAGYLLDVGLQFLAPDLAATFNPALVILFTLAEGSMLLYLLIRGVRPVQAADHALQAA
ncbi:DUF4386 domain-containing protein [Ornithinimicrobium cavernae]|uniref:DUF4386 domain-containing protein n=1 Tax=Ornithinimicrobium cavernae TaxID=2666047 RepID=UPI00192A19D0|nr:DUF4386 domain-containing protein [Ornithinimicrobium cavernae]